MNQVEHAAVHLRDVERIDGFIVRLAVAAGRGARLAQEEIVERYDNCAGAQLFELIAQNLCGRCFSAGGRACQHDNPAPVFGV